MGSKKNGAVTPRSATNGYRIRSVEIRSFKSVVKQTIELGRMNVFVGANGSGKTAILEAIGVLGAAADGRVDDSEIMRRGVRPGVPQLYKNAFADMAVPRAIVLHASSSASAEYRATLDNPQDSPASPWRFSAESIRYQETDLITRSPRGANHWNKAGKKQGFKPKDPYRGLARIPSPFGPLPEAVDRLLATLRDFVIYDPQTAVLRGTQVDMLQRDPLGLQGGRLAEAVSFLGTDSAAQGVLPLEELRLMIDWMADVDAQSPTPDLISPSIPVTAEVVRFADRFMRADRNRLSAYDASEGALFVLFAMALLLHPRAPRFFAIENIDHTLHPRLARYLIRELGELTLKSGRQILLTTHSPLVLDGLRLEDDEIRLFTVERDSSGHTEVRRIQHSAAIKAAMESGLTLSAMWTRGLLGAVPNLG
jgi:predicted ATPase